MRILIILMSYCFLLSLNAYAKEVLVKVDLIPAGSFEIKGKILGHLKNSGEILKSKKLSVAVKNLKTGIELRDEHLKKRFKTNYVTLKNVEAYLSKGVGILNINNIKKKIKFSYEKKTRHILAKFSLKLSDFKITDVDYLLVKVDDEIFVEAKIPVKNN